jgi:hypothetical protein
MHFAPIANVSPIFSENVHLLQQTGFQINLTIARLNGARIVVHATVLGRCASHKTELHALSIMTQKLRLD